MTTAAQAKTSETVSAVASRASCITLSRLRVLALHAGVLELDPTRDQPVCHPTIAAIQSIGAAPTKRTCLRARRKAAHSASVACWGRSGSSFRLRLPSGPVMTNQIMAATCTASGTANAVR